MYKWKHRTTTTDRSHTAHRLQTHLTPAQEAIVVYLRRALLLPLDDRLAVIREFLCPDVSRSGLDRCLRRHGVGNLNELKPKTPQEAPKSFKAYEPGYLHIDIKYLPQMADETRRRYLFVAIDRATRWIYVALKPNKTAASAERFLKALHTACYTQNQRFNSAEDLEQTLMRYVYLYNHQLPQSALHSRTPIQAMKDWYQTHPNLFNKRPYNHPGCDSYF